MRAVAAFILQGRSSALLVMTPLVALPLLQLVSAAALALVTLRRGPGEGAFLAGVGTLILLAAGMLGGVSPLVTVAPALTVWVPTLIGASVLRGTVSWPYALQTVVGLLLVGLVGFHAAVGDATDYWQGVLEPAEEELASDVEDQQALRESVELAAAMMTGAIFRGFLVVAVCGLLLGRYWQALLFNPGGFQREFHALRLPSHFALVTLALFGVGVYMGPGTPVHDAGLLMITVFVLQALAVLHAVAQHRGWRSQSLIPAYLLLPVLVRPAALVGLMDVFGDLRRRLIGSTDEPS